MDRTAWARPRQWEQDEGSTSNKRGYRGKPLSPSADPAGPQTPLSPSVEPQMLFSPSFASVDPAEPQMPPLLLLPLLSPRHPSPSSAFDDPTDGNWGTAFFPPPPCQSPHPILPLRKALSLLAQTSKSSTRLRVTAYLLEVC